MNFKVQTKRPSRRGRGQVANQTSTKSKSAPPGKAADMDAKGRIWGLADLAAMARDVFGNDDAAKAWLRTPNRAFHDVAPMDYLDTEPGAISVRQVLNAIATGGPA